MLNLTGQVARDENFFDREADLKDFWSKLESDNLLLLAPRRVGKTSVLYHMQSNAQAKGFCPIFVDVSDCQDELRFVKRLYDVILEHHNAAARFMESVKQSSLGQFLSSVKKVGVSGFSLEVQGREHEWADIGEEITRSLEKLEQKTLIQIDELPVFALKLLNHEDETKQGRIRDFLYWLRRIRLQYTHVRWMLAGSVGLDTIASRLNITDAINDLAIVPLGAYTQPIADQFLLELARSYNLKLEPAVRQRILERVGWLVPYYLQLVFSKLRHHEQQQVADVDAAIDTLLSPTHKAHFDYWRQRLRDELGRPDADHAALMLHAACRTPQGVRRSLLMQKLIDPLPDAAKREEKGRYLLDTLVNDGYLVEKEKYFSFQSPLLREYWVRHVAPSEKEDE
jgi:hypothetical protein